MPCLPTFFMSFFVKNNKFLIQNSGLKYLRLSKTIYILCHLDKFLKLDFEAVRCRENN